MARPTFTGSRRPVALRGMFWFIDRWRQSQAFMDLTIEEQGAYRNLLDEAWLRGGGIPNDPALLAKASGDPIRWKFIRKNVLRYFENDRGTLRNRTLTTVRRESQMRAERQRNYREKHNAHHNGHHNADHNE